MLPLARCIRLPYEPLFLKSLSGYMRAEFIVGLCMYVCNDYCVCQCSRNKALFIDLFIKLTETFFDRKQCKTLIVIKEQ